MHNLDDSMEAESRVCLGYVCDARITVGVLGSIGLAYYVMACVHFVFAICMSMTACNGVALSVAVMVAVASVRPVVAVLMGSTVNMAATMATTTTSPGGHHLGRPHDS